MENNPPYSHICYQITTNNNTTFKIFVIFFKTWVFYFNIFKNPKSRMRRTFKSPKKRNLFLIRTGPRRMLLISLLHAVLTRFINDTQKQVGKRALSPACSFSSPSFYSLPPQPFYIKKISASKNSVGAELLVKIHRLITSCSKDCYSSWDAWRCCQSSVCVCL